MDTRTGGLIRSHPASSSFLSCGHRPRVMGKGLEDARAALSLAFAAVNSASDAFPPLKSVSGGLLFCVKLAQTVQSNKRDYAQLLKRIAGIAHDLANADDSSSSSRTAVGLRVDAFRRCLEKLQEDLEFVNRRGRCALRANQHKEIIQSCNEELDRFARDIGVWANLLLIRNVDSIRQRPATLTDEDLARVTALLSQQLSSIPFRPPPLPPDPPDPQSPSELNSLITKSSPNSNASSFHFSASPEDGVNVKLNLHIRPATCVLFAYEVRGGGL